MSLKRRSEAAGLRLLELAAVFPAGHLLRSDENHETTGVLPYVAAIYSPGQGRSNSRGEHSGQESGLLSIVLRSSADVIETTLPDPAAAHAENVDKIREALVRSDFAAALTAAAEQPYHCLRATSTRPPVIQAKPRQFQEIFTWEIHHLEVTCS